MIKLNPHPTFEAPVLLTVPGQEQPAEITMTFRHMAVDKVPEWFKANESEKSANALCELIEGWSGVLGDDGQVVPYSQDALATLLKNYGAATTEILQAWMKALNESRVKN